MTMDWDFCICLYLFCAFQSVLMFNIDPVTWKYFTRNNDVGFGYRVIQRDPSSLLVSDPLVQYSSDARGQVYSCAISQETCLPVTINVPSEAVNMSLGLFMTKDTQSSNSVVCGPTIPKDCKIITTLNGMCFNISGNNVVSAPIPRALRSCPLEIDIAFLMDGSESVEDPDFIRMKTFVITIIQSFSKCNSQFAVAQFSTDNEIHSKFETVKDIHSWRTRIGEIKQQRGWTYTAKAINKLMDELFIAEGGVRQSSIKILIVITDGRSNDEPHLRGAVEKAKKKNIIRFAVGIGEAFDDPRTKQQLEIIASAPVAEHVFNVTDFDALDSIREQLEENIAIEGVQSTGDSAEMEFAQDGFSAVFTSNVSLIMSSVGAFQGKGGYQEQYQNDQSSDFHVGSEQDSYLGKTLLKQIKMHKIGHTFIEVIYNLNKRILWLSDGEFDYLMFFKGYSMTVATRSKKKFVILGAPRYRHKGQVSISIIGVNKTNLLVESPKSQIGSYFGAEVCVVDLNSDAKTDLLLISAPTYIDYHSEGRVFVYFYSRQPYFTFSVVLVGMAGQRGRFGSSLASPADLNGDGFMDVLIGAPLEEDGQGSIYIFNGGIDQINPKYSQRITGSAVRSGLHFFGLALSQSSLDHSGDSLPDIAVGSKGAVLLLRSRPIVSVDVKVTYSPSKISTVEANCTRPLENTLTVCFKMSGYKQALTDLAANISYRFKLDAKRHNHRAYFLPKNRVLSNVVNVTLEEVCKDHPFLIESCTEDSLNPLLNELMFTFEGLPSQSLENLKPVLLPWIKNTTLWMLNYEINCGSDNLCVDNLKVDFSFDGSTNIEVGIMQELNVTVFVENRGENSYNTLFTLSYPFGLSYRRIMPRVGRVDCRSLDGMQGVSAGETICRVNNPLFGGNTSVNIMVVLQEAVFHIIYSINKESHFDQKVTFNASVTSGNTNHSENSELLKTRNISVKHAIYVALLRHTDSSIYINFTSGKNNLGKPVKQILEVKNEFRELNLTVFIRVPVKLGAENIWADNKLKIPDCFREEDEQPTTSDFLKVLKKKNVFNCSVAVCAVFRCDVNLMRNERKFYNISSNVSSGWIEQIGARSASFELVSTASLNYDEDKYTYFSDSLSSAPVCEVNTQVEVYEEPSLLKEVIVGVIGGLLIISLITATLYKSGFFKRKAKQQIKDLTQEADELEYLDRN
ncbi:integrin alpha-X-like [Rhinichthys klamathensis goyatoka]|uniref:integrin alpha-X-like n=1 Tax=Rhinichthys klamathensis goyatoka TaxID=3034132 RepID=UPI0024B56953|nr:integrin alpha-X-like [Rhinichthys klamathensis goyatoka]